MEYHATFGIDHGLSHGFGLKEPSYIELDKIYSADNEVEALKEAAKLAVEFSRNYLSNPKTDFTTVTLLELHESKAGPINPQEILKKHGYTGLGRHFELENDKFVTKCHMLEHLLLLDSEKKS